MTLPTGVNRPVETVKRSVEIVDHLKHEGSATLAELSEELDCAKSTVHRHLRTLEANSLLVREGDEYRLGVRFLDYGVAARNGYTLFREAQPKVDELGEGTDEKIWCTVEEHGRSVHIYGARGKHSVRTYARVGQRNHLHQHAAGKSILAHLPAERVDEIIGTHGLPARTPHTITDEDDLAIGAISISGPANRLSGSRLREGLPSLLLGAVNEISINLAHA
jgi:DNA-binding IclR family transcriptional regulator